jgi:hypothetical protein
MARYYLNLKNKDALFVSKSQQYQERFGESRNGRKTNKDKEEINYKSAKFQD